MLQGIVGNTALLRELNRSLSAERFFHAYLFTGPAGSGKRTLARQFAKGILCKSAEKPCGVCSACHLFEQHNHPDYLELLPENGRVSVQMVRALLTELANRPYQAGYRVILMPDADRYNASCQNTLLKTLEEPPQNTVFILLAEKAELLLPTIRSRTRIMRMGLLTQEEIYARLMESGIEKERALYASEVAGGNLGDAFRFSADEEYWNLFEYTLSLYEKLCSYADCIIALQLVRSYEEEQRTAFLNQIEKIALHLLHLHSEVEDRFPSPERMSSLVSRFTTRKIHVIINAVISARKRLNANVAWPNCAETVLFAFL